MNRVVIDTNNSVPALLSVLTQGLLLDMTVNPDHAPPVVAKQIGGFSRQVLSVDLVQPADPTMPPRLVAAGHGDIAVGDQTLLYRQVVRGLRILRIDALQNCSLVSLCILKSSGMKSVGDKPNALVCPDQARRSQHRRCDRACTGLGEERVYTSIGATVMGSLS